jgi:hypothetical protein
MKCEIRWIDCAGRSTEHDAQAIAYAVHKEKRYPICAAHLETLKGRRSHHQADCPHLGGFYFAGLWSIEPLVDPDLYRRYRFFHENAGYIVGMRAVCALRLARAEQAAKRRGLEVIWENEMLPWDGDCPPPKVHAMASVYHPDRPEHCERSHPHYYVLAHLGSIGLDSWRDEYKRVVEAELFIEALDALDEEDEQAAHVLAQRATYAGVLP